MTIDHTPYGLDSDVPDIAEEHTDFPTSEALDSMDARSDGVLVLNFTSGDSIEIAGLPRELYEGLKSSPTPGTFFNDFIRGRF